MLLINYSLWTVKKTAEGGASTKVAIARLVWLPTCICSRFEPSRTSSRQEMVTLQALKDTSSIMSKMRWQRRKTERMDKSHRLRMSRLKMPIAKTTKGNTTSILAQNLKKRKEVPQDHLLALLLRLPIEPPLVIPLVVHQNHLHVNTYLLPTSSQSKTLLNSSGISRVLNSVNDTKT